MLSVDTTNHATCNLDYGHQTQLWFGRFIRLHLGRFLVGPETKQLFSVSAMLSSSRKTYGLKLTNAKTHKFYVTKFGHC